MNESDDSVDGTTHRRLESTGERLLGKSRAEEQHEIVIMAIHAWTGGAKS